jgi:hypothetical protein
MRAKYVEPTASAFINYYQQRGGKLASFRGDIYGQRGAGLGSIFAKVLGGIRGLISNTPEWVKEATKQVGRTGMEIVSDTARQAAQQSNGEAWKKMVKQKTKQGTGELLATLGNKLKQQQQSGKGIKRKRQSGKGIKRKRQKVNKVTNPLVKRMRKSPTRRKPKSTTKIKSKVDFLGTI